VRQVRIAAARAAIDHAAMVVREVARAQPAPAGGGAIT
jgi:hypothetical protein